jgi:hypothetical protein
MQCLDAAGRTGGAQHGWATARAVARLLSPVEIWFKGGHSYYRPAG